MYFDDVKIDELKIKFNNKNFLLKIQYYIFEHLQHINHIFINMKLAEIKITKKIILML